MFRKRDRNALIIGHFGAGNFGDDLMLASMVYLLSVRDVSITVLAKSKSIGDVIEEQDARLNIVRRNSALGIVRALIRSKYLILGGGTHFQDNFHRMRYIKSLISLLRFLSIFIFARLMSVRIGWIGVGVGPVQTLPAALLIKACAMLTDEISVRDEASAKELAKLGIERVKIGFDLAALLPDFERNRDVSPRESVVVGVSLFSAADLRGRHAKHFAFWEAWKEAIEIAFKHNEKLCIKLIVFLDLGGTLGDVDDLQEVYERLLKIAPKRVTLAPYVSTRRTLEQIADCDRFLAARYHSAVAAGLFGLPMIVAPYDRKVEDVAHQFGLKEGAIFANCHEETAADMAARIDELILDPDQFRPKLLRSQAYGMSQQNALVLDELLNRAGSKF